MMNDFQETTTFKSFLASSVVEGKNEGLCVVGLSEFMSTDGA